MIVEHLNTSISGGAGNAARQLHRSLLAAGVTSRFWHGKTSEAHAAGENCQRLAGQPTSRHVAGRIVQAVFAEVRRLWLKWELKRNVPRHTPFTLARIAQQTPRDCLALDGDILHLHWISRLVDLPSFFRSIPDEFPIVWTLHDMNPMTGGCHYSGGCERFVSGCGDCPKLRRPSQNDLSRRTFRDKQNALREMNLHIVTPSRWLEGHARRSLLLSTARSVQTIHNGIDVDVFSPQDKQAARASFGLPANSIVIGFGADFFGQRGMQKGFHKLLEALSRIETKSQNVCLAFGNGEVPKSSGKPMDIRSTGYIHDPHELATVYSAADIFVLPSLEDNLPTTGLEAMACGTPVVAFETGGIPDFVRPGESGCLARTGDAADLARQMTWMIEHSDERRRMGETARQIVLRDFHHARQAEKYVQLYQSLMDAGRSRQTNGRAA